MPSLADDRKRFNTAMYISIGLLTTGTGGGEQMMGKHVERQPMRTGYHVEWQTLLRWVADDFCNSHLATESK